MANPFKVRTMPEAGEQSSDFAMRHYSPAEIGELWGVSVDTVRRLFEKEPGVLVIGDPSRHGGKRRYLTMRIPLSVLERVHRKLTKVL